MVVLLVLFTIISFLTVDYFVQQAERRRLALASPRPQLVKRSPHTAKRRGEPESSVTEIPDGFLISPGHIWIRQEPTGSIAVGIDRLMLSFLGAADCVYTLPESSEIREGGPLLMLRRGNRALKIRSPIAGVILKVNDLVRRWPQRLAQDPFKAGWVYRVSPSQVAGSLNQAVAGDAAGNWMLSELARLRDLLQATAGPTDSATLADGGLPLESLPELIDDRDWEQLVAAFFAGATEAEAAVPAASAAQ